MTPASDRQLYARSVTTLIASSEAIAQGCGRAEVRRLPGVAAAVFPEEPERSFYNNAVIDRGLSAGERLDALGAMQAAYLEAGVEDYAAWVHESDAEIIANLGGRAYAITETTRSMAIRLGDALARTTAAAEIEPADWSTYLAYLRTLGLSKSLLAEVDPAAFHLLVARQDGDVVAAALGFDHDGDCGIFNMSTVEPARRHGIATALTASHLRDAAARGCKTATLQSTLVAERVYASLGFHDLGRFLEHTPRLAPANPQEHT
jgi:GNAT superfamily N-acetyltransferase